ARPLRHAAASAAAILYPALRLDLVRPGIALYGIWPSEATRAAAGASLVLEPALRWTSKLVVVRDVAAETPVGYGCAFRTTRPSRIGVVPLGYAEGLPRALSGRGALLVAGRRAPLVGRVCMNMAFLDVTEIPQAHAGSSVTLLGRDGRESIDANELAAAAGTIGYELVARLPAEVPRRYLQTEAIVSEPPSAGVRS
ncbi:MAG: alanine racemase, partial [Vulcanimicrobiaceae bacterium]